MPEKTLTIYKPFNFRSERHLMAAKLTCKVRGPYAPTNDRKDSKIVIPMEHKGNPSALVLPSHCLIIGMLLDLASEKSVLEAT